MAARIFFDKEFVRIESKFQPGYSVRGGCSKSARAFTLVEIVVATLLLTSAVVGRTPPSRSVDYAFPGRLAADQTWCKTDASGL
jgi:hypothetical protein